MTSKKIKLTDAIVDDMALFLGLEHLLPGKPGVITYPPRADTMDAWRIVTAVLSHPNAAGLFTAEDDRPWEPLDGRPLRAGYEVRRDYQGITRTAVVGRVDEGGDPWAAEGGFIGSLGVGTWYFRRPVQELPTEDGAVIVPAEGRDYIEMADAEGWTFSRMTYSAEHDRWYGMTTRGAIAMCSADQITPGTWRTA